ncbi:MAG: translocation/assembly module TamB domain-containing protein [Polyangiaceae bacterium]
MTARSFELEGARASVAGGHVEARAVVVDFHERLVVDAPLVDVDLGRLSHIGSVAIAGRLRANVQIRGPTREPIVTAEGAATNFVIGGRPLGRVRSFHADYAANVLEFSDVACERNDSAYRGRTVRLAFGRGGRVDVDALVEADALDVRDLISILRLDGVSALASLGGGLRGSRARIQFFAPGRQERNGQDVLRVEVASRLSDLRAFGQAFDEGAVDVALRWEGPGAGVSGLDVRLRSLALWRIRDGSPADAHAGFILATGQLDHEAVRGSASVAGWPLARALETASPGLGSASGSLSGLLEASGTLDRLDLLADMRTTPVRVNGVLFGPSTLHAEVRAGRRVPLQVGASGNFIGGQLRAVHIRGEGSAWQGHAVADNLDVGSIVRALRHGPSRVGRRRFGALVSGDVTLASLDARDLSSARASFTPSRVLWSAGAARGRLLSTGEALVLADDALRVPPLDVGVLVGHSPPAQAMVWGTITSIARHPRIDLSLTVPPFDLGLLVGIVPDLQAARGTLDFALRAQGSWDHPALSGTATLLSESTSFRGLPADVRAADVAAQIDAQGIRLTHASMTFGGGPVRVEGFLPLAGPSPKIADLTVRARGMRFALARDVDVVSGGDFRLRVDVARLASGLPHAAAITGEAAVDDLVYRRPIDLALDFASIAALAARPLPRSAPQVYDPSRDVLDLDIGIKLRALRVDNDVADISFASVKTDLTSTAPAHDLGAAPDLWLRGTSYRPAVIGRVRARPGGHLHLRGIDFNVASATLDFDDPTRIDPEINFVATTEVRHLSPFENPTIAQGSYPLDAQAPVRITATANGPADDLQVAMTSEPSLSPDDIVLLLTVGLTRTELAAMQAATGSLQASGGLEAIAVLGNAQRVLRGIVPVDDFRFGSEYSPRTLRIEPDVALRKRLGARLDATVTTTLTEEGDVRAALSLRLGRRQTWIEALWENEAPLPTPLGDVGAGLRWRLQFR